MNAPEALTALTPCDTNITKTLNIALLGYRSHPYVGGQGIYLKYLSRALAKLGHNVDVISGPPYPNLDDNITLIKLPSLNLYEAKNHVTALRFSHFKSYTNLYEWWTMLTGGFAEPYTFGRRLKKYLDKQNTPYDVIHDNQSLCFGLLQLEKNNHPIVATIHHPISRDRELAIADAANWQYRLLVKRWYSFLKMQKTVTRKLKHVVTVSYTSQHDIHTHFGRDKKHTTVIPNGIDTELFRPIPNISKIPFRLITTASSDQPLKGLKYLLKALKILSPQYKGIELTVIGKLDPEGSTQKLLDTLAIKNHVRFISDLSDEAMVQEYNQAQIAICPSLYEGFGLPAGEAMSCGLPVISTDGGALPEVVGEAGIVVKKADAQALASAIQSLLKEPAHAQALGLRARERILAKFCWDKVAMDLTRYYERLKPPHANH